VEADVAILWDFESFWAQDLEWRPTEDLSHQERIRAFYEQLWRDNITVDFALPGHDLSRYKLVIAPAQYLLTAADAENLKRYVAAGGTLLVSYFSAVVDENDAVHPGGYLAPLREVLGVDVEEHLPLRAGETAAVTASDGALLGADHWQEALRLHGADVFGAYAGGPGTGMPAITRNAHGDGAGWYVSTRLDAAGLASLMRAVYVDSGVTPAALVDGLEVITRRNGDITYLVAVNHSDREAEIPADGHELLTDAAVGGSFLVPAGGVAVIRTTSST
jgi:beta-galactosidase